MDVLTRAYSQLADLYRSMTPGSRLTAGLLAAVVLLSMGYLATHQVAAPDVDLMHGVPVAAGQLPLMEAAFHKASLQGYVIRGTSIYVPHGQEPAYMAALADAKALPGNFGDALREAISAGAFYEDRRQREQRIKTATQDTLAQFICAMPGIERAYVLCDVDSKPGFNRDKLITAMAGVKPAGTGQLDEARVSAIRYLVAPAFAGLKPENVTVSDLNGGRTWHGDLEIASAEGNRYLVAQRTYEQDLKAKILNALCFIPNATVDVTVKLSVARAPERQRVHATGGRNRRAGRPAAPAQPSNTATILSSLLGVGRGHDAAAEQEAAEQDGREQTAKQGLDFAPTLARVSVGVPIAYFKSIWRKRNSVEPGKPSPAPDPAALDQIRTEESAKIQRHVAPLLPSSESVAKAGELVTVTTFEDLPVAEPPAPLLAESVLNWARQSWATLGTIGLGLVSLLVLRSMVRHGSAPIDAPAASPNADDPSESIGRGSTAVPPPHAQRFYEAGASPHNELSKLVEDDPESAANVLRTWIGHVD